MGGANTHGNNHKAERLAILWLLDREGLLEGLTHQEVDDVFGVGHRSTIQSLQRVKVDYQGIRGEYIQ